ncbi:MAG: hypothetical protein JSV26_10925 [bacterium]|nr:MAG: hypothetical protein JSV26_10925 [bacterium]
MSRRFPFFPLITGLVLVAAAVGAGLLVPGGSHADPAGEITDGCRGILTDDQVVVYYFHRKFRCPSCLIVESTLHETFDRYFSSHLGSGRLAVCVVNLDDAENRRYIDEFDILFNSVIVVERKSGKALRFKNLEKIWDIYTDREATIKHLLDEISPFLRGS